MLTLDPAVSAHLAARKPIKSRRLLWVSAQNRATGAIETMGLWTGDDHQDFTIKGESRTYYGAGSVLEIEGIRRAAGLDVRTLQVKVSAISPEVEMLIRGYDARLAPVEIHRVYFDPATDRPLAAPHRIFKGWIDEIDLPTPAEGQVAAAKIKLASNARAGTRGLTLKKSDESQKLRRLAGGAADRFYQYTDVSGAVPVRWGEK